MEKNFSTEVHRRLNEQMGVISEHIIRKQCFDLGIMPEYITVKDLPELCVAIAEAFESLFGLKNAEIAYDSLMELMTTTDKMDYIITIMASIETTRGDAKTSEEFIRAMKYYNELILLSKNEQMLMALLAESRHGHNLAQHINAKLMEIGQMHKRFVKKENR